MNEPTRSNCVILGGGGHASVLIDCLRAGGDVRPTAVLDADRSLWGRELLGVPIKGGDDLLAELAHREVGLFAVGAGSVGESGLRRRLFDLGLEHRLEPLTVIHPRAMCSPAAEIGPGGQLLPGSIVNAGAVLGVNVIVNSGAIVEHDCSVGDHGHVATGAQLAGAVRVGPGAHIGVGAAVRQGIVVGAGALVGAGAVVVKDVPSQKVAVGVPARVIRDV